VGKETIVGLMVALRRFAAASDESRRTAWQTRVEKLASELAPLDNAVLSVRAGNVPKLALTLGPGFPKTAMQICIELQNGAPSIHVDPSEAASGTLIFNPACLTDGDVPALARRVNTLVGRGS
jgi:hypothetical protein